MKRKRAVMATGIRFTREDLDILEFIMTTYGVSTRAAAIRMAIRMFLRDREHITVPRRFSRGA